MRLREVYDRIQNKRTALRSWISLPIAVAIFVLIGVVRYFSRCVFWESWRWAPGAACRVRPILRRPMSRRSSIKATTPASSWRWRLKLSA